MSSALWRNKAHSPSAPHQSSGAAVTVRREFMVPGERSAGVLQSKIKYLRAEFFFSSFSSVGVAEMKDVNPFLRDQDLTKTPSSPGRQTWVGRGKLTTWFCFHHTFFSVPKQFSSMNRNSPKVKNKLWKRQKKAAHWGPSPWTPIISYFIFFF